MPAARIFVAELCTASHPDTMCSYRREGSARLRGWRQAHQPPTPSGTSSWTVINSHRKVERLSLGQQHLPPPIRFQLRLLLSLYLPAISWWYSLPAWEAKLDCPLPHSKLSLQRVR